MTLTNTKQLLERLKENAVLDSYAVLLKRKGEKGLITSENVDTDTYFDIASMGKILTTATLILKAMGENRLVPEDTLERFFDDVPEDRKNITVKQLLTHTSGIVRCEIPANIADKGSEAVASHIIHNPLAYAPGKGKIYSCNAFILLGFIVEKLYKMPLDKAFEAYTKQALGLTRSGFNIRVDEPNAAVSYRRLQVGSYRCDDDNVYNMKGVAGSGAQFWTMADMEKYCDAVLEKSPKLYAEKMYAQAEQSYTGTLGEDANGLGWLIVDERYKQTGKLFAPNSFGHCGHTGTSFFFNRKEDMYAVILTNATRCLWLKNGYIDKYEIVCEMRETIHNTLWEDIEQSAQK